MPSVEKDPEETPFLEGHWLLGSIRERRENPLGFYERLAKLGDVASCRVLWLRLYVLNHPEWVKHVLVDNARNYVKGQALSVARPLLGNGLLTAEGELWKKNRRLAQPAFHRERLAALVEGFVDETDRMLERWRPRATSGAPFDLHFEMMSLTMSIVARALFGADLTGHTAELSAALSLVLEETNRRILTFNPWIGLVPGQNQRAYGRALRTLDERVLAMIAARRREDPGQRNDLLALLMEAKDENSGEQLSDRQLRDEVMTLFLAGHETTANALTWLWIELSRNPSVTQTLRREVSGVLGAGRPKPSDFRMLAHTSRAFDEALRLHPPVWIFSRRALRADQIGGHRIPAGANVLISPYLLHRHPKLWDTPERFDPERFSPERSAARPKLAFIPFGAGQRLCIGSNFAAIEAQVIVSMVLRRFELSISEGQSFAPAAQVTLRPSGEVRVTLKHVTSSTDGAASCNPAS
jgi:cytochrome P450